MNKFFRFFFLTGMVLVVLLSLISSAYAVTADDAYQAGVAYYKQGQLDECANQMNAAIALNPNYWQAYQVLGYVYYKEGNTQSALDVFNKSLQINPNNPQLQQSVNKLESQNVPAPPIDNPQNNSTSTYSNPTQMENSDSRIHNSFYFNLSGVTPTSPNDFTTHWGTGGGLGIAYGFGLNNSISLVLSGQYSNFPYDYTLLGYTITGGNIETAMFLVNAKFILVNPENPVDLYLITGIGPSLFARDAATVTAISTNQFATAPAISEVDFAFRFGLGIDIKLSRAVYLYLETNGVGTFVSQTNAPNGAPINNMFSLGMKFDN